MACLTCEELESKICELAESLATGGGCVNKVREADVEFDYTADLTSKRTALQTYQQIYKDKGCDKVSEGLWQYVQTACVTSTSCYGGRCRVRSTQRRPRRYQR